MASQRRPGSQVRVRTALLISPLSSDLVSGKAQAAHFYTLLRRSQVACKMFPITSSLYMQESLGDLYS